MKSVEELLKEVNETSCDCEHCLEKYALAKEELDAYYKQKVLKLVDEMPTNCITCGNDNADADTCVSCGNDFIYYKPSVITYETELKKRIEEEL